MCGIYLWQKEVSASNSQFSCFVMAILLWRSRPQIYIIFIFACWSRCSTKNVGLSHIANSTLELPCVQVQKATNTSCALNQAGDKYFSGGGGPCHYLFSKEEPLSQIHWSSGLYKLIATGPKPSVMLNLLPSTRALGELCNLVWSNRRLTWSPWAHFHQSQVETPHGSCSIFWGMQSPIKSSSLLVSG